MWWWLLALLTAHAAPDAPLTEDSPITEAPKGKQGLVETLRRQLMLDNEDYLPSESEGIPMRARLSDEENYHYYDEEKPERPGQVSRQNGTDKEPQTSPTLSKTVQAKSERREAIEPRPDHAEIRYEEDETLHSMEPQVPVYNYDGNTEQTHAIPKKDDRISIEKYDQDYEFKENKQFLENVQIEEHDFEGDVDVNTVGALKLEDNALRNPYEIEMEKHFEDKPAGDSAATLDGFVPRAHYDEDGAHMQLTTKKVNITSEKPGGADISISKKDLLYYMDEEKFAKSNLSIGFNADVAVDYRDFTQPVHLKSKQAPVGNVSRATKTYRVLKMRGANGRRSGRSGRRFIQEEGATGVAIVNVDAGPFPEFRLPRERRQYMQSDQSEADPAADFSAGLDPALTPSRPLEDHAAL